MFRSQLPEIHVLRRVIVIETRKDRPQLKDRCDLWTAATFIAHAPLRDANSLTSGVGGTSPILLVFPSSSLLGGGVC
jgi:hypothetical protein